MPMKIAAFCTLDAFSIGTRLRLNAREHVMNMRPMFGDGSIVRAPAKSCREVHPLEGEPAAAPLAVDADTRRRLTIRSARTYPGAERVGLRLSFRSFTHMPRLLPSLCALLPLFTWSPWSPVRAEQPTIGLASFYAATQSSSQELTSAHRTLPFGTMVAVTRVDNGAQVVVRINDRGPFLRGSIIDLSRRAAGQLGMIGRGLARVRIQVIPAPLLAVRMAADHKPAEACLTCLQAPILD